jgi:enoyl-CoA hydratase / 3-hydroxyacyl-CoA dehydrogenase
MKNIKTVGVVGAGTMGSAIAQKFAQENFNVVLADRNAAFVKKGIDRITKTLVEGIERKVFTEEQVDTYLSNIRGTENLDNLKNCDLVVEAIFEDFEAKAELFRQLDDIVSADTILATNTSSFSVTDLAASVSHPERFIGLHYFYHAAKNRLVEIIPGERTASDVVDTAKAFATMSGKDSIVCRDSYGFVVNRFFVPWLNEAVRLLDENIANIATIDDVCMKTFDIGMGPFALMNATGVPVAYHAEKTLERFGSLYAVAHGLKAQVDLGLQWDLEGEISHDEVVRQQVSDRFLGVVFFVCTQLLDEEVCTAADINRGAKIGLKWRRGPVELMQYYKEEKVWYYIHQVAGLYQMPLPKSIGGEYWQMQFVALEKKGSKAIITINRPEDLNALNENVMAQLDEQFTAADSDPVIDTIFITGAGKAFVAGADIKFFIKNIKTHHIDKIETFTGYGQEVFKKIDESSKTVVSIINGLALGGGLELALCADVILALPKAQMAFPETGIGIYPGLGGTQRCARKIGKPLCKYLIHTGKFLDAKDAEDIGLVDKVISADQMFGLFSGKLPLPFPIQVNLTGKWRNIELFFKNNTIGKVLSHEYITDGLKAEDAEKIFKTVKQKAPIALNIADKLIDEAKGCDSELKYLDLIFSTSDALLGLSSIGKRVEYQGN